MQCASAQAALNQTLNDNSCLVALYHSLLELTQQYQAISRSISVTDHQRVKQTDRKGSKRTKVRVRMNEEEQGQDETKEG